MGWVEKLDPGVRASDVDLPPQDVIFGSSRAMAAIQQSLEKAASANVPVLLQGQSGTGKEILARFIHQRSPWGNGAFVKVNCPAIPGTLLESELFGYQRGAFTGAYNSKPGRVELAHRGTLFLDEIAELEPGLQAKLLQLLQDGQFCRIGAQEDRQVDVRVVSATNRQLEQGLKSGTFRQDLFYRINIITVELPTLRERSGDIPMLAHYFLEKYSNKYDRPVPSLSNRILEQFQKYSWPGNIRELENVIKRYVILGTEEAISKTLESCEQDDLNFEMSPDGRIELKKVTRQAVKQLERKIILKVLEANRWNRSMAARALSISYAALLYKMREAGLPPKKDGRRRQDESAAVLNSAVFGDAHKAQGLDRTRKRPKPSSRSTALNR